MKKIICLVIFVLTIQLFANAQVGAPSSSFGQNGLTNFSFRENASIEEVVATLAQPDGKYVQAFTITSQGSNKSAIARYSPGGIPDNTFNTSGYTFIGRDTTVTSIFIQNDGKIVAAGYVRVSGNNEFFITRINNDGSRDIAFDANALAGLSVLVSHPQLEVSAGKIFNTVVVEPITGSIYASGAATMAGLLRPDFVTARFLPDGTLDQNFNSGTNPIINFDFSADDDIAYTSIIKGDTLYVAGSTKLATGFLEFGIGAININAGGYFFAFPPPFNSLRSFDVGAGNSICRTIGFTATGQIVMAGIADNFLSTFEDMAVVKLTHTKNLDPLFGSLGIVYVNGVQPAGQDICYSMSVNTTNDTYTLAGFLQGPATQGANLALVRVTSTGALDPSFGASGIVSYHAGNANEGAKSVVQLPTGNYIVGGYTNTVNQDAITVSFTASGIANTAFGNGGKLVKYFEDAKSILYSLSANASGQTIAIGASKDLANADVFAVAKFLSNGSLDVSFGNNGIATFSLVPSGGKFTAGHLFDDGSILLCGTTSETIRRSVLVKLLPNGQLNTSFAGGAGYALQNMFVNSTNYSSGYIDLKLLQDNSIVLSGLVELPGSDTLFVQKYTSSGATINSFGNNSIAFMPAFINDIDIYPKLAIQSDGKIVLGSSHDNSNFPTIRVMRIDPTTGGLDASFNSIGYVIVSPSLPTDGYIFGNIEISSQTNGILVSGARIGASGGGYIVAKLNYDGSLNNSFGVNGRAIIQSGPTTKLANATYTQSDGKILVAGLVEPVLNLNLVNTLNRLNADGSQDNTFNGGQPINYRMVSELAHSLFKGGYLYVVGEENNRNQASSFIMKINSNPPSGGRIVYNNINKTFGDADFFYLAKSNSPAPITYKVVNGACATIEANTGRVSITCAGPTNTVVVRAVQQAIGPYDADSAEATIAIAKATPTIRFPKQGVILSDITTKVYYETNSDGLVVFSQIDGQDKLSINVNNIINPLAVGVSTVVLTTLESDNYLMASAVSEIAVYLQKIPPKAVDDEYKIIYGTTLTTLSVLDNDTNYTGIIQKNKLDLDPETPGVQKQFSSPAFGFFNADTLGNITFIPLSSFIGQAEAKYTVADDNGDVSNVATIKVNVEIQNPELLPAMKAHELFTPNGDGLNDTFVIGFMDNTKPNALYVFDRYGNEVYSKESYQNDWGGTYGNGKLLDSGVYYYLFEEDNGKKNLKGMVEIRR